MSYAWTEDITPICLLLTGMENGVIGVRDIKTLADEEICRVVKEDMEIQRKPLHEIAHHRGFWYGHCVWCDKALYEYTPMFI